VSVEIIDLRTLMPLDMNTIAASVSKTHRAIIAHEAVQNGGLGAEIAHVSAINFLTNSMPRSCAWPVRLHRFPSRWSSNGRSYRSRQYRSRHSRAAALEGAPHLALVAQEIPKVGLVMENGRLVRWLKNVGDPVRQGEHCSSSRRKRP